MSLYEVVQGIVGDFGRDVLRQRARVLGLVADRQLEGRRDLQLLRMAYESGVVHDLLLDHSDHSQRRALRTLADDFVIDATAAREAVAAIVQAIGGSVHGLNTVAVTPTQPLPSEAASATLRVGPTGQVDFRSIHEAILNAPPGSVIQILPGVYEGPIQIDKPITVEGVGRTQDIILESVRGDTVTVTADGVAVRDLMLKGPASGKSAVAILNGHSLFERCHITGGADSAIRVAASASPTIRRCRIVRSRGVGMMILGGGQFEDCEISGHKQSGVVVQGGAPHIHHCRSYDSQLGSGIIVQGESRARFEDCDVYGNEKAGIVVADGSEPEMQRCSSRESRTSWGLLVHRDGSGSFEECTFLANKLAGVAVLNGGRIRMKSCHLSDSKAGSGLFVGAKGDCFAEQCELARNRVHGLEVKSGTAKIVGSRIVDNRENGVMAHSGGTATIQECKIHANTGEPWATSGSGRVRWI